MNKIIIRIKEEILITLIFTLMFSILGLVYHNLKTDEYLVTIMIKSVKNNPLLDLSKEASIINNKKLINFYFENSAKKSKTDKKFNFDLEGHSVLDELDLLKSFYFKIKKDLKLKESYNVSIYNNIKEKILKEKQLDPRFVIITVDNLKEAAGFFEIKVKSYVKKPLFKNFMSLYLNKLNQENFNKHVGYIKSTLKNTSFLQIKENEKLNLYQKKLLVKANAISNINTVKFYIPDKYLKKNDLKIHFSLSLFCFFGFLFGFAFCLLRHLIRSYLN